MHKEWYLDRYCGQQVAALLEDGKLVEFAAEKERSIESIGNIYKGKVANVLQGMQAAFVACGLTKNAYLSTHESNEECSKYDSAKTGAPLQITQAEVKEDDEILVQIVKTSRGNKGAKVTTNLSFVSKSLIYLPGVAFHGISRKITDENTNAELLSFMEGLCAETDGFIIRTQAPFTEKNHLKAEFEHLKKQYLLTLEKAKTAKVGDCVYKELDLPTRVVRDSVNDEETIIHVGCKDLYDGLLSMTSYTQHVTEKQLVLHTDARAMLRSHGISKMIYDSVKPTVSLDNGGYIVIDHTEAMTVVDVNSGSYVGATSLEETAFEVNLAAARETARQVRLRNVGGIVVVDFIDMQLDEHKEKVTQELRKELEKDKAKCSVLEMSELCLTQFTRKRVGPETLSYLVKPCKRCSGNGHVHDDIFTLAAILDELLIFFDSGENAAVVELADGVLPRILNERIFDRELDGIWKGKSLFFIPHKSYDDTHFIVRAKTQADESNEKLTPYN